MFWNQVERERELVGMFLNKEKKKIKEGGGGEQKQDTGHECGGEKQEKKEMKRIDENEMKEKKHNIKNKKS